jgi:hypothetical protein
MKALEPAKLDRRAIAALVTAAIAGVLANEFANPDTWLAMAPRIDRGVRALLWARAWQTGVMIAVYGIAPLVVARAVGVRPGELGLRLGEPRRVTRLCLGAFAIAVPTAFALSFTSGFRHVYPLFAPGVEGAAALAAWLPMLATMLFCVELFYRGFLLALLTPSLGRLALFVMIVPYALTHRDLVEALGAVGVGLFFGVVALRSRSIWMGWLVHVSVAFAVEAMAIWQARRH